MQLVRSYLHNSLYIGKEKKEFQVQAIKTDLHTSKK